MTQSLLFPMRNVYSQNAVAKYLENSSILKARLKVVFNFLFLSKIQPAVYIRIANSSRGVRQLGWASCLTSAGRVTLASGTTFLHINALARLTGTSLGAANVT